MAPVYVVLNAGSSSLKFQIFEAAAKGDPQPLYRGLIDGIGGPAPRFTAKDRDGKTLADERPQAGGQSAGKPLTGKPLTGKPSAGKPFGHEEALVQLVSWTRQHQDGHTLAAVGHRVVHGGLAYNAPVMIDDAVLHELEKLIPLVPLHQPHNLEPIRIVRRRLPDIPQIACFDTAFHRTQPEIAQLLALPRAITERGVRRYGFHGLSYEYIASALDAYDPRLAKGRVVVAHLGNGASLCALKAGVSIATSMGFSSLDGLPMGTRCGALDPGVIFYMLRDMKLSPDEAENILYKQSGLIGVSGLSNDMRTLRSKAATHADARRAIDLFVYRAIREIGSLVAALDGLDGLVFTAGIGENDAATRAEIMAGLGWAGLTTNTAANQAAAPRISASTSPSAWIIPTNEEIVIARHMQRML